MVSNRSFMQYKLPHSVLFYLARLFLRKEQNSCSGKTLSLFEESIWFAQDQRSCGKVRSLKLLDIELLIS